MGPQTGTGQGTDVTKWKVYHDDKRNKKQTAVIQTENRWWSCTHWRDPVPLKSGLTVYASAWFDRHYIQEDNQNPVDMGFYLDKGWMDVGILSTPGLEVPFARRGGFLGRILYPWDDMSVPQNVERLTEALIWLYGQVSKGGRKIDIGCVGGHGRTGTLLSLLQMYEGTDAWDAIHYVRANYCRQAVETMEQVMLVRRVQDLLDRGKTTSAIIPSPSKLAYTTAHGTYEPIGRCLECGRPVYNVDAHKATHDEGFDPATDIVLNDEEEPDKTEDLSTCDDVLTYLYGKNIPDDYDLKFCKAHKCQDENFCISEGCCQYEFQNFVKRLES